MLDDNFAREAGDFVEFLLHRDAFDDVAIGNLSADLGQNRQRVRIPFDELLANSTRSPSLILILAP